MPQNPQNILFISHSALYQGAEKTLVQLIEGLDRSLYNPSVIIPGKGYLEKRISEIGIKTHIVPLQRLVAFSKNTNNYSADKLTANIKLISEIIRNIE